MSVADGSRMSVYMHAAREAWSIELRALTAPGAAFLHELAHAGGFLVRTEECALVTSEATRLRALESDPDCLVVTTADDLGAALLGGLEAWMTYAREATGGAAR